MARKMGELTELTQPACHLLTVREINPPVRDFHPLENFAHLFGKPSK